MNNACQTNGLSGARLLLAASLSLALAARAGECMAAEPETHPEVAPSSTEPGPPLQTQPPASSVPEPSAPPPATQPVSSATPQPAPTSTPSPSVAQGQGPASDRPPAAFQQETFLGEGPVHHGGYGGPLVRASQVAHETALFIGGRGGWLVDHRLLIGGAGLGQTLNIDAPSEAIAQNPNGRNLELGYGGFFLGYHIAPEARVHGFVSMLIGAGGITLSDRNGEVTDEEEDAADTLFVLEPELALEANLIAFMRIQLSIAYRQVWDTEMPGLDNQDLSGIAGGVALLFGQF